MTNGLNDTDLKELFRLTRELGHGAFNKRKAQRFNDLFEDISMPQRREWDALTRVMREELLEEQRKMLKEMDWT